LIPSPQRGNRKDATSKKEAASRPVPCPPFPIHLPPLLTVVTGMRVMPAVIAMVKPVVAVEPSVPSTAIIRPAITAANNDRTRTAPGEKRRGRKYGRGRQKHPRAERIHHDREPSRLRRRASRTNAHRYETE
jgi:hypothetical protein